MLVNDQIYTGLTPEKVHGVLAQLPAVVYRPFAGGGGASMTSPTQNRRVDVFRHSPGQRPGGGVGQGAAGGVDADRPLRAAGARRGRLPHQLEMEHGRRRRRRKQVRRLQRRRGRARHLQRPRHPQRLRRPGLRGDDDRRPGDRRPARHHLSAVGIHLPPAAVGGRAPAAARRKTCWARISAASRGSISTSTSTWAPGPTSAAKRRR